MHVLYCYIIEYILYCDVYLCYGDRRRLSKKTWQRCKKPVRPRVRVKLAKMQKTARPYSTDERTYYIYDCERVSTNCEAEDRKIRVYLTR